MKRLRFHYYENKIRFFACGEYGEELSRPHYHICLFNLDFEDKYLYEVRNGNPFYRSETLEKIWTKGFSDIGEVNYQTAAYTARYIMKKISGDAAEHHYKLMTTETGELNNVIPEFTTMSTHPGLGRYWYEKYKTDVFPDDFIVIAGKRHPVPAYYDKLYELEDLKGYSEIKKRRIAQALLHKADHTPERLRQREQVKKAQTSNLKRNYENAT